LIDVLLWWRLIDVLLWWRLIDVLLWWRLIDTFLFRWLIVDVGRLGSKARHGQQTDVLSWWPRDIIVGHVWVICRADRERWINVTPDRAVFTARV